MSVKTQQQRASTEAAPRRLLGGLDEREFLSRYWQRRPLLVRNAIPGFAGITDRDALFRLAGRDYEAAVTSAAFCGFAMGATATAIAIAPLIAADIDSDHQHMLAQGLVGLAEGVSRHLVERGMEFDPDEVGQQVADLAWAGLRAVHRNP